jgi:hypothetical protein
MQSVKPLSADELYTRCDPRLFDFETTADLEALTEPLGQERAVDAIQFGTEIQAKGYNLYVLGQQGSGRHTAIRRILTARSATSRRTTGAMSTTSRTRPSPAHCACRPARAPCCATTSASSSTRPTRP